MLDSRLIEIIEHSKFLREVIEKSEMLGLDQYYVGAGCITQTVWNYLTDRPLTFGINDIDIIYFDKSNLSSEKESSIVKMANENFVNFQLKIDVKNQARVHLWYENKFGIKTSPYQSLEEAIDTWPTTATALGVRKNKDGSWEMYAPFGLDDIFTLTLRPNKKLITEDIYYKKVEKWTRKWPELKVIRW
ncbi:nucleotidyltransferase family protein [Paenibacillus thiaminolyticus]|uniref:nucleotidyltransferase family protein n=1 Tax=Paenibacillus thiaminolyticus TaxID=49283 RepID=UPI002350EDCC|nr:nucleotidyltransferase family protein [Paenibacillus thiaminolyticus]MDG0875561.1 nucleotidyltransferase family protein [Paenibacillus thiaminolyticus]WCR28134.1 nucleotidyltransferase family protein [Paenibacillus thiaminolyticus]